MQGVKKLFVFVSGLCLSGALRPAQVSKQSDVFECDEFHPLCIYDTRLLPDVLGKGKEGRSMDYKRRLAKCLLLRNSSKVWPNLNFQHIPKNAGTAVEKFADLDFHRRDSMRLKQDLLEEPPPNFYVVLRHPIERFVSWYNFLKAGHDMEQYEGLQRYFCNRGTGRTYHNECIPKVSLYEFISSNRSSILESEYLYGRRKGREKHRGKEAIGTDANFMFEWLKPNENATMDDVKDFLLERFALIGDTAQLEPFLLQLASLRKWTSKWARKRIEDLQRHHINPTHSKAVMEYFSEDEYETLARRHAKDIELYYWVVQQVSALNSCFPLTTSYTTPRTEKDSIPLDWWDFEE